MRDDTHEEPACAQRQAALAKSALLAFEAYEMGVSASFTSLTTALQS